MYKGMYIYICSCWMEEGKEEVRKKEKVLTDEEIEKEEEENEACELRKGI